MRNLGLLLKDRTLDPFTFRKAVPFENVRDFLFKKKKGSVCGLILQWIFLKRSNVKVLVTLVRLSFYWVALRSV